MINRRHALALGLAVPGAAALASCGPNASGGSGGDGGGGDEGSGSSAIRLAWWGNPTRDEMTQQVVDAYAEVEESVTISPEPGEWSGYWDKLATQAAGGDLPDVIQMDEKYISEYGGRGTLLDLADAGLDTSEFAEGAVEVGELAGEGLMAINAGLNAAIFLVNPAVFEMAGVEMPDDSTWTWDDLIDIAVQISENTDEGIYGMTQMATVQALFQVWVRQMGQDQYKDGGAGFDAEAATSLMEYAQRIQETGAGPDASVSVEDAAQSLDQSLFATDRIGITVAWSNQIVAHDAAVPGGVTVLRPPSMTGSSADAGLWYKASMYWSISATAQDPEAALAFVDYLANSPDAGSILSVERGVPPNLQVRDAIMPELDDANLQVVEYIEAIEGELGPAPELTPPGAGELMNIINRAGEDMLFGSITAEEAGQRLVDELEAALS